MRRGGGNPNFIIKSEKVKMDGIMGSVCCPWPGFGRVALLALNTMSTTSIKRAEEVGARPWHCRPGWMIRRRNGGPDELSAHRLGQISAARGVAES